jgi:superoxide dismutase, Cu-Zn family
MISKAVFRSTLILATAIVGAGCSTAPVPTPPAATASLLDAQGAVAGSAAFSSNADGSVTVVLTAAGVPAGPHGIHIHAVGICEAPGFTTAGGHFNPAASQHGMENPAGPHGGDLPNLTADAAGRVSYRATTTRVTIGAGATGLFDADGSALVIHAGPDDNRTDPSGNSGARILCGVIRPAP